jgi:secreted trypsin-like serine protease
MYGHRAKLRRRLKLEALDARHLLSADALPPHDLAPGSDRIVGGIESQPGAWPWMASLQSFGHFCGGTLVAADAVVTAAHCVEGTAVGEFEVVLGKHDLSAGGGKSHQVSEIIIHPEYESLLNDSDIAVVLLDTPSNQTTLPVLHAAQGELAAPGQLSRVLGWGVLTEGGNVPDTLHEVSIPIVSNEVANQPDAYNGVITERMLAAGLAAGGKDSCQGDSGGPLMVNDDSGQYYLAGIVSWGDGCARPNKYGIYTRVTSFGDWIDDQTRLISAGSVNFTQERYSTNATAEIRLKDADLSGAQTVSVVVSTDGGDHEAVILTESVPGRFTGDVQLAIGAIAHDNRKLDVSGGERLQVTYQDDNDGTGQGVTVNDTALVVVDDHSNEPMLATDVLTGTSIMGEIEISGDVDWFRFDVDSDMMYRVDVNLTGTLNDSVVEVYDDTGEVLVGINDDSGSGFASSFTWFPGVDGKAHVKVLGYGSNIGTYELLVTESVPLPDDHGDNAASATAAQVGQTINGELGTFIDVDWFSFSATAGRSYEIATELTTLDDSVLRLIDADGSSELGYNDDAGAGRDSRIVWRAPSSGMRYVEVSGFDGATGQYRLEVAEFIPPPDDHGDGVATATLIQIPSSTDGAVGIAGDEDWFGFTASRGSLYQFDVELGTLGDSVLSLHDSKGAELDWNDDFGDTLGSRIVWSAVRTGQFYLNVRGYESGDVGSYQLHAKLSGAAPKDDHGNDASGASTIELPAAAAGAIEVAGDVDWFEFATVAGLVYEIRTTAGSLGDTTLRLVAADGVTELGFNDDNGFEITSYLRWTATSSGPLYAEVAGYGQLTGSYTLSVSVPYGDANLDGIFNSSDLVQVFQYGEYEDQLSGNSEWSNGDWNGDGEFDSADLIAAFQGNEYSAAGALSAAQRHDAVFAHSVLKRRGR